jgi:hypothetical protein
MLSLLSLGVNHENWITFYRTCESRKSKQEDVDDDAEMHGYNYVPFVGGSVCL